MNESKTIFIVEDEKEIVDFVIKYLERENYNVKACNRGDNAVSKIIKELPDLLILDILLPGKSGLQILKEIRNNFYIPVILLTSRVEEVDRVLGLEMGADDYITKPFSPRELVARVKAIFRRIKVIKNEVFFKKSLKSKYLTLELDSRKIISKDNKFKELTSTEFNLLKLLMKRPGRIFSREELLDYIWGKDFNGETRTIDVHIKNLKKKIAKIAKTPALIRAIRGVGYVFED